MTKPTPSRPKELQIGHIGWQVATELCVRDYCGCEQESAPCDKAVVMAGLAIATIEAGGVAQSDIENLASGCGYRVCDGDCHSECGEGDYDYRY